LIYLRAVTMQGEGCLQPAFKIAKKEHDLIGIYNVLNPLYQATAERVIIESHQASTIYN
jgi:hypothetical protein